MDVATVNAANNRSSSPTGHIVVVEDNLEVARLLEAVLAGEGYHVTVFGESEAALAGMTALHPDLIILDLTLASTHGQNLLTAYRAAPGPQAPVLV